MKGFDVGSRNFKDFRIEWKENVTFRREFPADATRIIPLQIDKNAIREFSSEPCFVLVFALYKLTQQTPEVEP